LTAWGVTLPVSFLGVVSFVRAMENGLLVMQGHARSCKVMHGHAKSCMVMQIMHSHADHAWSCMVMQVANSAHFTSQHVYNSITAEETTASRDDFSP
jgi:hypothetical protein